MAKAGERVAINVIQYPPSGGNASCAIARDRVAGPLVIMFERSLQHCSGQFMGQLLLLHPHREPFIINKLAFSQSGLPFQQPGSPG
jgi:hypothetical protein